MLNYSDKNYTDFFKEEVYGGFVDYLLNKYGARDVNQLLRGESLMTKKGVHPLFQKDFRQFLIHNPLTAKEFHRNHNKFFGLKNVAGENLAFPIDPGDDMLMIKEGLRVPEVIPVKETGQRATKEMKRLAAHMQGQTLKGITDERRYVCTKRLTVHFKESYAKRIGKTTMSFMIDSRSEAMDIILNQYEKRVAYATIQGVEEFCFVKPRNGKVKRTRKLRG